MRICEYLCVFANPICGFVDFFLLALGRAGKPVSSSHKHHGAISSLSGVFVCICVYLCVFVRICGFCKYDFFGFSAYPATLWCSGQLIKKHYGVIVDINALNW